MKGKIQQFGMALAAWLRHGRPGFAGVLFALGIGLILSFVLARQTSELLSQPDQAHADLARNAFQYQADNLMKLWTVIAAGVVGYVGWLNFRVTQQNLEETKRKITADREASDANLRVAQEAQITNRFTQAIGQLGAELKDGKPNLEVRLGGIYALERIASDSPRDHWAITEVLTAYVRQNASWPQEAAHVRADIQAILTVLGRRELSHDRQEGPADLPDNDLRKRVPLHDAFIRARLDLHDTDLRDADLRSAQLQQAFLWNAHLETARLRGACLQSAFLLEAHLERARLVGVHMDGADLSRAHFDGADLTDAYLNDADLTGADLRTAEHLTEDQIKSAVSRTGARLPPHLAHLEEREPAAESDAHPPSNPVSVT